MAALDSKLAGTFPVSASYFKQPGSIQGVRVHFQLGTSGFGINVDALVFNSVSGTDASGTVVRYKVRPLGFFLPGEPGRRYVTSFCFLRAEFRLVCHSVGLADGGRSSLGRQRSCVYRSNEP